MNGEKVKFNNLSTPLKISVIISFAVGVIYAIAIIIGFVVGVTKTI